MSNGGDREDKQGDCWRAEFSFLADRAKTGRRMSGGQEVAAMK